VARARNKTKAIDRHERVAGSAHRASGDHFFPDTICSDRQSNCWRGHRVANQHPRSPHDRRRGGSGPVVVHHPMYRDAECSVIQPLRRKYTWRLCGWPPSRPREDELRLAKAVRSVHLRFPLHGAGGDVAVTCADYDAATAGLNAGATRAAASSTGRCRSLSAINDYRCSPGSVPYVDVRWLEGPAISCRVVVCRPGKVHRARLPVHERPSVESLRRERWANGRCGWRCP